MSIEYRVRHAISGRIRLRVPALKQNERLAQACAQLLERQEGVTGVRSNQSAASLVIEYDPYRSDIPTKLKGAMSVVTPSMLLALSQTPRTHTKETNEKEITRATARPSV